MPTRSAEPPAPWGVVAEIAVGGLHSIGFVPKTDVLLVISQSGRGLFDGTTGARLARDRDASWEWYADSGEEARAFGFSDSGQVLAVAVASHTVELYAR